MKLYANIQKKSGEIRERNRARTQKLKQKVALQKRSLEKKSSETSRSEKDVSEKGSVSSRVKTPSQKSKSPEESRAKSPQPSPQVNLHLYRAHQRQLLKVMPTLQPPLWDGPSDSRRRRTEVEVRSEDDMYGQSKSYSAKLLRNKPKSSP